MNFPLVSVIIPTYNRESIVSRAIESVIGQSYPNWELIVVDDGSEDRTWNHLISHISSWKRSLLGFGKNQKSILLYQREHSGVSRTRNFGVEKSSGEWISFLDSDDEWLPHKLKKQMEFHALYPEFEFSQTKEFWNKNGNVKEPKGKHKKISGHFLQKSLELCMVTNSSFMAKKKSWMEIGGFRDELLTCEDYDLWNRILIQNQKIGLVDEALLIRYGGHDDQLSMLYPAMERFRLYSLILTKSELQTAGKWNLLPVSWQKLWDQAIEKRFSVLISGRKKRGLITDPLEKLENNYRLGLPITKPDLSYFIREIYK